MCTLYKHIKSPVFNCYNKYISAVDNNIVPEFQLHSSVMGLAAYNCANSRTEQEYQICCYSMLAVPLESCSKQVNIILMATCSDKLAADVNNTVSKYEILSHFCFLIMYVFDSTVELLSIVAKTCHFVQICWFDCQSGFPLGSFS